MTDVTSAERRQKLQTNIMKLLFITLYQSPLRNDPQLVSQKRLLNHEERKEFARQHYKTSEIQFHHLNSAYPDEIPITTIKLID